MLDCGRIEGTTTKGGNMNRISDIGGYARLAIAAVLVLAGLTSCPSSQLTAGFSGSPRSGSAPLVVQFTDLSTEGDAAIDGWLWDFGDGKTSTEPNPVHEYSTVGAYDVSLTVTAGEEWDQTSKSGYIEVTAGEGEGEGEGLVTPQQSQAMIDEVAAEVMAEVASSPLADVLNDAVDSLEGQEIVSSAGLSDTGAGAWARLIDGSYYLLIIDPKPDGTKKEMAALPATVPAAALCPVNDSPAVAKSGSYGHLPAQPMIFLNLDADDPAAAARVQEFAGFAAKYGYSDATGATVAPDSSSPYGTVQWFSSLAEYSVVYINSKGMHIPEHTASHPLGLTAILTRENRDLAREMSDSAFWGDIQAGHVLPATVFGWADNGHGGYESALTERYAVSSSFITKYCDYFDDGGSLVYLDGGSFRVLDMEEAFRLDNVTLFVGWSGVPASGNANTAARYLFSRAFGEQILNAPSYMPNRSFPFDDAVAGLAKRGWNVSPSPYDGFTPSSSAVKLDCRASFTEKEVLFRPTLDMNMNVTSDGKHLHIYGSFGDNPGTVTVGGINATVEEWSGEDGITAGIDFGDWGDVVVTVGGKQSQAIPLHQWHGKFSATGTNWLGPDWGAKLDVTCNASFRADVHPYRVVPDTEPVYSPSGADFESPATTGSIFVHGGQYFEASTKSWFKWDDHSITLKFKEDGTANAWGVVTLDHHEGTAKFTFNTDMFYIDYRVYDENWVYQYTSQWPADASFDVSTDMGLMGTIGPDTGTDPVTKMQVTIPQMLADPMTDFDNVPL